MPDPDDDDADEGEEDEDEDDDDDVADRWTDGILFDGGKIVVWGSEDDVNDDDADDVDALASEQGRVRGSVYGDLSSSISSLSRPLPSIPSPIPIIPFYFGGTRVDYHRDSHQLVRSSLATSKKWQCSK